MEKYGLSQGTHPLAGLILRCWGVFLGSLFLFLDPGAREGLRATGSTAIVCFAGAGILASLVGQIFSYQAFQKAEVSRISPIMGSWPLVAVLLGWMIFHEPLTVKKAMGTGLILCGVWLLGL